MSASPVGLDSIDAEEDHDVTGLTIDERDELVQIAAQVAALPGDGPRPPGLDRLATVLGRYQEQPQLLDSCLASVSAPLERAFVSELRRGRSFSPLALRHVSEALWTVASVRGAKALSRTLCTDVGAFVPCVRALETVADGAGEGGPVEVVGAGAEGRGEAPPSSTPGRDVSATWQCRTLLLLHLSQLALIPVALRRVDPRPPTPAPSAGDAAPRLRTSSAAPAPILSEALEAAFAMLDGVPRERDAAALVVARLVARPDAGTALDRAVERCASSLEGAAGRPGADDGGVRAVPATGALRTLATVLGHLPPSPALLATARRAAGAALAHEALADGASGALDRKLRLKVLGRAALAVLVCSKRGDGDAAEAASGDRDNRKGELVPSANPAGPAATASSAANPAAPAASASSAATTSLDAPAPSASVSPSSAPSFLALAPSDASLIESLVARALGGLSDRDTVVRWAAAKAVGRVTGRLPAELRRAILVEVLGGVGEGEEKEGGGGADAGSTEASRDPYPALLGAAGGGESGRAPGAAPPPPLLPASPSPPAPLHSDARWHGSLLALAETLRRGAFPASLAPRAAAVVAAGLQYDLRRGAASVGAHVRDAAAFGAWSMARGAGAEVAAFNARERAREREGTNGGDPRNGAAGEAEGASAGPIAPSPPPPHAATLLPPLHAALRSLAPALLATACLDREVGCRRAAAAALQEAVGRTGRLRPTGWGASAEPFQALPRGIEALGEADFFRVAARRRAFLEVAPAVAALRPEYRDALVERLCERTLVHWDPAVRALGAQALGAVLTRVLERPPGVGALPPLRSAGRSAASPLAALAALLLQRAQTAPEVEARHGALLGAAALLDAARAVDRRALPAALRACEACLVQATAPAWLRGRSGDALRGALCALVRAYERGKREIPDGGGKDAAARPPRTGSTAAAPRREAPTESASSSAALEASWEIVKETWRRGDEAAQAAARRALEARWEGRGAEAAAFPLVAFGACLDEAAEVARDVADPRLPGQARRGAAVALAAVAKLAERAACAGGTARAAGGAAETEAAPADNPSTCLFGVVRALAVAADPDPDALDLALPPPSAGSARPALGGSRPQAPRPALAPPEVRAAALSTLGDLGVALVGAARAPDATTALPQSSLHGVAAPAGASPPFQPLVVASLCGSVAALFDYETDDRGDVGSWARVAGCESLSKLSQALCDLSIPLPPEVSRALENSLPPLLRQVCERLGRVRGAAVAAARDVSLALEREAEGVEGRGRGGLARAILDALGRGSRAGGSPEAGGSAEGASLEELEDEVDGDRALAEAEVEGGVPSCPGAGPGKEASASPQADAVLDPERHPRGLLARVVPLVRFPLASRAILLALGFDLAGRDASLVEDAKASLGDALAEAEAEAGPGLAEARCVAGVANSRQPYAGAEEDAIDVRRLGDALGAPRASPPARRVDKETGANGDAAAGPRAARGGCRDDGCGPTTSPSVDGLDDLLSTASLSAALVASLGDSASLGSSSLAASPVSIDALSASPLARALSVRFPSVEESLVAARGGVRNAFATPAGRPTAEPVGPPSLARLRAPTPLPDALWLALLASWLNWRGSRTADRDAVPLLRLTAALCDLGVAPLEDGEGGERGWVGEGGLADPADPAHPVVPSPLGVAYHEALVACCRVAAAGARAPGARAATPPAPAAPRRPAGQSLARPRAAAEAAAAIARAARGAPRRRALRVLGAMCSSRFPALRRHAADHLHETLLLWEIDEEGDEAADGADAGGRAAERAVALDEAADLVAATRWEADQQEARDAVERALDMVLGDG